MTLKSARTYKIKGGVAEMIQVFHKKLGGGAAALPQRASMSRIVAAFIGGSIGIGLLALLTQYYDGALLMAPFGATCVLLFAIPDVPFAQPRNVIGGHVVATTVGLVAVHVLPFISPVETGVVVGLGIAAMQITRTLHPPAGANPLVVIALGPTVPWSFLITPALTGAVILVLVALVVNNVEEGSKWPKYWF